MSNDTVARPAVPENMPAMGQYDVVKNTPVPPDFHDTKYVRHGAQTIGMEELNGQQQPVRRVTISGLYLTFDKADRSEFLHDYNGKLDIKELYIFADTVTIKTGLSFPQTHVFIISRVLRFEGADSYIDTSPKGSPYRDPLIKVKIKDKDGERETITANINGQNGANAGHIALGNSEVRQFRPGTSAVKHLRANGGAGQEPDEGGLDLKSTTRKDLETMTEDKWKQWFTYARRHVRHEGDEDSVGQYWADLPVPQWKEDYTRVTYMELQNKYWDHWTHLSRTAFSTVWTWGSKELPGTGANALLPGKPGTGGNGGNVGAFYCEVGYNASFVQNQGGISGKRHMGSAGGPGGTPQKPLWLVFQAWPENRASENHPMICVEKNQEIASSGKASGPGPDPDKPTGKPGKIYTVSSGGKLFTQGKHFWINPIVLNVVVQGAKDALATEDPTLARTLLLPYKDGLDSQPPWDNFIERLKLMSPHYPPSQEVWGSSNALLQLKNELNDLLKKADLRLDQFGNPPAWVPTLSLESAVGLYENIVRLSIKELYNAYYLEKRWKKAADKAQALKDLINLLKDKTEEAQKALVTLRDVYVTRQADSGMSYTDEVADLLRQIKELSDHMKEREDKLIAEADKASVKQEEKKKIVAAFKILGGVVKAFPLPEPYETAKGFGGTLLETTSDFIEKGGVDEAFQDLQKKFAAYKKDEATIVTNLTEGLADDIADTNLEIKQLEVDAKECKQAGDALKEKFNVRSKARNDEQAHFESLIKNRKDIEKADPKDLKRYDTLQAERRRLEGMYQRDKSAINEDEKEIATKKGDADIKLATLEATKKKRAATVKKNLERVQNAAEGVATIGKAIAKLMVSRTQLNSMWDAAFAKIKLDDDILRNLASQKAYINEKQAAVAMKVLKLDTELNTHKNIIAKNLVMMDELRTQYAKSGEAGDIPADALDPCTLTYIQSIGQDAHHNLMKFLYYVVKAYEYYTVQPWGTSYLDAQRYFENLRRVLEPSSVNFEFPAGVSDKDNKQKRLEELLKQPPAHTLTAADFELLKMVYEKPILDMGRKLADQLMNGTGRVYTLPGTITLKKEDLSQINEHIQSRDKANQMPFNLAWLDRISATKEKQRIDNIKVIKAVARKLPGRDFPDSVTFKFTHIGKSILRANGKLYIFDPEGKKEGTVTRTGVTFQTIGQKIGASMATDEITYGTAVLQQPDTKPQANLLSNLLKADKLVKLSEFRPGVFSDFLLTVEFSPQERTLEFTELTLEIMQEEGDDDPRRVMVTVFTNTECAIPITADQKNLSGRTSGTGSYVGIFDGGLLSKTPVKLSVPSNPEVPGGELVHTGWIRNGQVEPGAGQPIAVAKSAHIIATFIRRP